MITAIEVFKRLKDRLESGDMKPDEPVFLLRAQDDTAADTVVHWANKARAMGTPEPKVAEALLIASKMEQWPVKQLPGRPNTRREPQSTPVQKSPDQP